MKSLALQPQGNKFIRENNRFIFTRTNLDFLAHKARSVISIFLGEWFLDESLGIPYIPKDDIKTAHRAMLENALKTKITAIEGIKKITYFYSSLDSGARILYIEFVAETEAGEILEIKDNFKTPIPGGKE